MLDLTRNLHRDRVLRPLFGLCSFAALTIHSGFAHAEDDAEGVAVAPSAAAAEVTAPTRAASANAAVDAPVPGLRDPHGDLEPTLSLSAQGGMGWMRPNAEDGAARFAHGRLSVDYLGLRGLVLSLDSEFQSQARTYLTTLPAMQGSPAFGARTDETRIRLGMAAGWDALNAWPQHTQHAYGVLPRLLVNYDRFNNDILPHASLELGAGVAGYLRVADRLRLDAAGSYQYALELGDAAVRDRLAYGVPIGSVRYGLATVLEFAPRAAVSLGYSGEWLSEKHLNRFGNDLLLGLSLDI